MRSIFESSLESSLSDSPIHLFQDGTIGEVAGRPQATEDEVLSIEDLANRFNVSTKTI